MKRLVRACRSAWFYLRHPRYRPVRGCKAGAGGAGWVVRHCRGRGYVHESCAECGALTCFRGQRIESRTLRRTVVPLCGDCYVTVYNDQRGLRAQRTRSDWELVSTPVRAAAIVAGEMGEQFPGLARTAIRAFAASSEEVATVPDVDAATLNETIRALGLRDTMYAETRGKTTVLRRTPTPADLLPIRGRRRATA